MPTKDIKFVDGLPTKHGHYWTKYKIKGKRKEVYNLVFYFKFAHIMRISADKGDFEYNTVTKKYTNSYDLTAKEEVVFDYIKHIPIPVKYIPNFVPEDYKGKWNRVNGKKVLFKNSI